MIKLNNMKKDKIFKFNKKPLSSKSLLEDEDIMCEKNEFEDMDENLLMAYLCERYGVETLGVLYGLGCDNLNIGNIKRMKKNNKKSYHKTMKGKKKKKDYMIEFDDDSMLYDAQLNDKTIYFYRDVNNPQDCELFDSLHDFDNFCEEEGIEISDNEVNLLMTREISHTCINPYERMQRGRLRLMSSGSYGDLRWNNAELEYEYD